MICVVPQVLLRRQPYQLPQCLLVGQWLAPWRLADQAWMLPVAAGLSILGLPGPELSPPDEARWLDEFMPRDNGNSPFS